MKVNILGNGLSQYLFTYDGSTTLACNYPPISIKEDIYGTCIVDEKVMRSIHNKELSVETPLILGAKPKLYLDKYTKLRNELDSKIKNIYLTLPKYAIDYSIFNCGHFATHYACSVLNATQIHLYGFDSLFKHTTESYSDNVFITKPKTSKEITNMVNIWRDVWVDIFKEFPDTEFICHYDEPRASSVLKNVKICS